MSGKRGRPRRERYALLMGGLWKNPKIRRISNEALGVLTRAWSYAASEMTDGLVPVEMLEMWAKPKRWPAIRAELTARHPASDGCRGEPLIAIDAGEIDALCHDFTTINITRANWEKQLEADRNRKGPKGGFPDGNPTGNGPGNPTGNDPDFQPDAPDEDEDEEISSLRSESRARDAGRSENPKPAPTPPPSPAELHGLGMRATDPSKSGLVRLWAEAYATKRRNAKCVWLGRSQVDAIVRGAPMPAHRTQADALEALAQWLADEHRAAEHAAIVERVLAGAFADPWMREATYPLARIAAEPGRYLQAPARGRAALPSADEHAANATTDEELGQLGLLPDETPEGRAALERRLNTYAKGVLGG
ncbi:hypothetical protein [Sandaracinus amylolyticus]|uniref:hypothetical protein n=1 Tax=Sandaracinus amylolyticus TaxID=927083 RepID=UPI001F350E5F|nr:hypothetical protein [Sandaracinus amylolyticus]UJR81469.1 Hypothetical protein I5071_35280 [Sandaracinus amylolyticus]